MNVDTIVSDVKSRAEIVKSRGQDVVTTGVDTIKTANTIVVDGVQTVFKTNVDAGKELISLSKASFEKAKTDGVKAVAAKPFEYVPEGKDTVVGAYKDTVSTVTKTGEELLSTFKTGYSSITASINGKPAKVKAAPKKAVRKTATKARKTTAKAASAA